MRSSRCRWRRYLRGMSSLTTNVAYWRSDWTADATAVAFKCGAPEGTDAEAVKEKYADWRMEAGHTHPDVNGFILYAHHAYLTGVSGYAGVPRTEEANVMMVDGHGQGHDGHGHDAWEGMPYAQLAKIHLVSAKFSRTWLRPGGRRSGRVRHFSGCDQGHTASLDEHQGRAAC